MSKKKDIEEKQLSEQLQALFLDVEKISEENKKQDIMVDLENLSKTLSEIGSSKVVPFEFEFLHGGPNEKFSEIIRSLAPNTDNLEFLDFLQSKICKKLLIDNKLKIHVEAGNIYYDNTDINESIHEFIIAQQNPISGTIDHCFTFDRDYARYFEWLINGFSAPKKKRLDMFKNKNSKFLFYHFNDYLQQNGQELKKIKHSVVTQDYIAAQEIQDKNWQYFVESVLSYSNEPKEKESQKPFQLDTLENVTILKKIYEKLYDTVAKQFYTTLQKLPLELSQEINDDFRRENFDVREAENLDSWVAFYLKHGRFPRNQELIILPQGQNPYLIDPLSVGLSPIELYNKFGSGESKGLVYFQAVVALFIYYGGERLLAKRAMDEWKSNLLFQTLSKESDEHTMQFEKVGQMVYYILRAFLTLESDFQKVEEDKAESLEKTLDSSTDFEVEEATEIIATSTPARSPIRRPPIPPNLLYTPENISDNESAYLKTALAMSKTNLDASIEAAKEENKEILCDIVDPTPGLITNELFTEADLDRDQNENDAKFKLANRLQKALDKTLNEVSAYISLIEEPKKTITFPHPPTDTRKDFEVSVKDKNLEVSQSALQTKIVNTNKRSRRSRNIEKRSPYNLRKRKFDHLSLAEALSNQPFIISTIPDQETKKIKAVESIVDSIVKQLPDQRKKLKFDLDQSNDIKISEL